MLHYLKLAILPFVVGFLITLVTTSLSGPASLHSYWIGSIVGGAGTMQAQINLATFQSFTQRNRIAYAILLFLVGVVAGLLGWLFFCLLLSSLSPRPQ
jgi:hypothetical protein